MPLRKAFSNREKLLILILAVIALALLYYRAIHVTVTEGIAQANERLEVLDMEKNAAMAKLARMRSMQSELEGLRSSGEVLVPIPKYDNQTNIMVELDGTLRNTMSKTISFKPVTQDGESSIYRRVVSVSFKTDTYVDALNVIDALYRSQYRCQISDMKIHSGAPLGTSPIRGEYSLSDDRTVNVALTITYFEALN